MCRGLGRLWSGVLGGCLACLNPGCGGLLMLLEQEQVFLWQPGPFLLALSGGDVAIGFVCSSRPLPCCGCLTD